MSGEPPQPAADPRPGAALAAARERPIRLCVMATVASSVQVVYRGRLEYLARRGFEVTVVCAPSDQDAAIRARGVRLITVPLRRPIAPWQDLRALLRIWRILRRERFELVEAGFPKTALLGVLAARLAGGAVVVHVLHGLVYEGRGGLMARILRAATALPCRLAHRTYCVSPSLREQAIRDGLAGPERLHVLGSGSCGGVDLARFTPERCRLRPHVRAELGIPPDAVVVGFVGRMTRAKGLPELSVAMRGLLADRLDAWLLLVGDYEAHDRPAEEVVRFLAGHPRVRHVGWQADPVPYMAAADMVVLPSRREGLGTVLLEAAALGLPTVASDATGCRDAVQDGQTGLRFPVGDAAALRAALARLAGDAALRARLGAAGCRWVREHFDQERVWALWAGEYRRLVRGGEPGHGMAAAGAQAPAGGH